MARIPNSLIGAAGEYHVAAELSHRGWLATVTIKNAPGTDVLAQHYSDGTVVALQVKTTLGSGSWILGRANDLPGAGKYEWVVLVALKTDLQDASCWLLPRNHAAALCWVSWKKWMTTPGRGGTQHQDNPMRIIRGRDIERYRNQWEWLRKPASSVPYSLLPEWLHEAVADPRIGLRSDHPGIKALGAVSVDP